jgi:hypothetical protein
MGRFETGPYKRDVAEAPFFGASGQADRKAILPGSPLRDFSANLCGLCASVVNLAAPMPFSAVYGSHRPN